MGSKNLDLCKCQCNIFRVINNYGDKIIINNFENNFKKNTLWMVPLCTDDLPWCLDLKKFKVSLFYILNSNLYYKNSLSEF